MCSKNLEFPALPHVDILVLTVKSSPPDALLVGVGGPDPGCVGEDPLHDVGVLGGVVDGGQPGRGVQTDAEVVGVGPVGHGVVLRGEVVAAVQTSLPTLGAGH